MSDFKYNFGQPVFCQVTGFSGVITSRSETITGQRSYAVQPPCRKGRRGVYPDSQWFDEGMLHADEMKRKTKLIVTP